MTKLCARGKAAAKRKFKVYPSAYANAYASKICAGKIKDPSGKKRKDWGPKKMNKGGGADMSKVETEKKTRKVYGDRNKRRQQLKEIQNPISEYGPKGKLKYTGAKVGMNVTAGGQSAIGRLEKSGMRGGGIAIKGTNFKGVF